MVPEISVEEVKKMMDGGKTFVLVDVRRNDEHEFTNIGGTLIPLDQLESRFRELDPKAETVVYCRSGARSATATRFLLENGFANVRNLRGGILEWGRTIDPSIKSY